VEAGCKSKQHDRHAVLSFSISNRLSSIWNACSCSALTSSFGGFGWIKLPLVNILNKEYKKN